MALQKISTKRKHYFWAILMTWFVGLDQEETPSNKILFSKLAASMIQKSALETPKEIVSRSYTIFITITIATAIVVLTPPGTQ